MLSTAEEKMIKFTSDRHTDEWTSLIGRKVKVLPKKQFSILEMGPTLIPGYSGKVRLVGKIVTFTKKMVELEITPKGRILTFKANIELL